MTEVYHAATPEERPLSIGSFQGKLDKFERYIADVTLQNTEASVEEKRQAINGKENFLFSINVKEKVIQERMPTRHL